MEQETDAQAWLELDRRFHLALCDGQTNPVLRRLLDAVRAPLARHMRSVSGARPRSRAANAEHRAILEAVRRRDAGWAEEAVRTHLARARPGESGGIPPAGSGQVVDGF
jgi:DNA-binding FadR family transcriptional regulator